MQDGRDSESEKDLVPQRKDSGVFGETVGKSIWEVEDESRQEGESSGYVDKGQQDINAPKRLPPIADSQHIEDVQPYTTFNGLLTV